MRWICSLLPATLLVLTAAPELPAQSSQTWAIGFTGSLVNFRGASSDGDPSDEFSIRPAQGGAFGMVVLRDLGRWAVSLGVNRLRTSVEGASDALLAQVRGAAFDRVRLTAQVSRQLAPLGDGRLELRVGPTVDRWTYDGDEGRIRGGGEGQLAFHLPLGRFQMEHHVGIGWSPSPFRDADVVAGFRRKTLRTLAAGMTLWFGL